MIELEDVPTTAEVLKRDEKEGNLPSQRDIKPPTMVGLDTNLTKVLIEAEQ